MLAPTPTDLKVSVFPVLESCFGALCFLIQSLIVTLLHQKVRPASPYSCCAFSKSLLNLMNWLKSKGFLTAPQRLLSKRGITDVRTASQQQNGKNTM